MAKGDHHREAKAGRVFAKIFVAEIGDSQRAQKEANR